jgi:hypothetical protein
LSVCFAFLVFLMNNFSLYFGNSYSSIATFSIRYVYSFVAFAFCLFPLFILFFCLLLLLYSLFCF